MCEQLRITATNLERGAAAANQTEPTNTTALESESVKVKQMFEELKTAVDNYHGFLESKGI